MDGEKVKSNFVLWMIDKLKNNEPVNIVTDQISNVTMIPGSCGMMRIVDRGCSASTILLEMRDRRVMILL